MNSVSSAGPDGRRRRVLIVDDDDLLREVARAALELVGGWEVETADSGAEAQRLAGSDSFDAIVLDVMMPGVDGPSTLAALRRQSVTVDIPVIYLTAKLSAGDVAGSGNPAIAGVIRKPFDPMSLAADIAALLNWEE